MGSGYEIVKRNWRDALIDWMNGLSFRIECRSARRRVGAEIEVELIRMNTEDKILRYEAAARRVAGRREASDPGRVLP